MLSRFLSRLGRFSWTVHNLIGHPLSEVLFQLGAFELSERVHEATVPVPVYGTEHNVRHGRVL